MKFRTFAEAYIYCVDYLLKKGNLVEGVRDASSIGSNFGLKKRNFIEATAFTFEVSNPLSSLFYSKERVINISYCIGSLIWCLSGSNSADWISYYNAIGKKFSDNGTTLYGAIGYRLFSTNVSQIDAVIKKLKFDNSCRRAVAIIGSPEDHISQTKDYPCTIALQYLIRNGALEAITYMRSQSAVMVLPYDAFLFMSLQIYIASALGISVGSYKHISGSFHLYEDEIGLAEKVIKNSIYPIEIASYTHFYEQINDIIDIESNLRKNKPIKVSIDEVSQFCNKHDFSSQVKIILYLYFAHVRKLDTLKMELLRLVPGPFKNFF